MFWKCVNLKNFFKFFKLKKLNAMPLTTKIMALYVLSTLSILAAVSLFLYPTLMNVLAHLKATDAIHLRMQCFRTIIIALLCSSLISIILGKLVAINGLKKLREFSDKMEKISADSLHARIHLDDWPKELQVMSLKFNAMLDRLQTSFIQIQQFSSDIAHELRNPLHNLKCVTELALTQSTTSENERTILESYMSEFHYLSKLVENLLFLARTDQRQIKLNKQLINARETILSIMDYYQSLADEKLIKMTCVGDAVLWADSTLFKRVLHNLFSNALKFTPKMGTIEIHILKQHDQVKIMIQDSGIGIAKEHLPHIFQRFYRVDSSRSTESGGLGLGLALVKSILELHQGTVMIASQLQLGTTVTLNFNNIN